MVAPAASVLVEGDDQGQDCSHDRHEEEDLLEGPFWLFILIRAVNPLEPGAGAHQGAALLLVRSFLCSHDVDTLCFAIKVRGPHERGPLPYAGDGN